jgi:hypothetical protein
MRNKELRSALAHLKRVQANPRLDSAQRERLRKGQRELEKLGRTGKPNREKIFRAVFLITGCLVETDRSASGLDSL